MNTVPKTSDEAIKRHLLHSILVNFILFQAKPTETLWVCLYLYTLNSDMPRKLACRFVVACSVL